MITLELPFPPSVNCYWRKCQHGMYITARGKQFRQDVGIIVKQQSFVDCMPFAGRLEVRVGFYPPDRRRRDLDNVFKALLDAMEHAGLYNDDEQIDYLSIERHEKVQGGKVTIELTERAAQ